MNRYTTTLSRAAFGFAAVAMTALTFTVAVVLPATLESGRIPSGTLATAAPTGTGTGRDILRIDVVGDREQATAYAPAPRARPEQKQRS